MGPKPRYEWQCGVQIVPHRAAHLSHSFSRWALRPRGGLWQAAGAGTGGVGRPTADSDDDDDDEDDDDDDEEDDADDDGELGR